MRHVERDQHDRRLIGTGYLEDQIAVLIRGTANEKASAVEELDLGLENGTLLFQHLQSNIGPVAPDFMGRYLESTIAGKRYHASLTRFQVKAFAAEQLIGGIVEHGLQLADVSSQL